MAKRYTPKLPRDPLVWLMGFMHHTLNLLEEAFVWLNTLTCWFFCCFSKDLYRHGVLLSSMSCFQKSFLTFSIFYHLKSLRIFKIIQSSSLYVYQIFPKIVSFFFSHFSISSKERQTSTFNTLLGKLLRCISKFVIYTFCFWHNCRSQFF